MTPAADLPPFLAALRAEGVNNRPLRECPSAYPLADYLTEIGDPTAIVWRRVLRVAPPPEAPAHWYGPPVEVRTVGWDAGAIVSASGGDRDPTRAQVTVRVPMPGGGYYSVSGRVTAEEMRALCRPEAWARPEEYARYTTAPEERP